VPIEKAVVSMGRRNTDRQRNLNRSKSTTPCVGHRNGDCAQLLDCVLVAEFSEVKIPSRSRQVAPTIRLFSLSILEVGAVINPIGFPREFTRMA
jgi:hypothetical protein